MQSHCTVLLFHSTLLALKGCLVPLRTEYQRSRSSSCSNSASSTISFASINSDTSTLSVQSSSPVHRFLAWKSSFLIKKTQIHGKNCTVIMNNWIFIEMPWIYQSTLAARLSPKQCTSLTAPAIECAIWRESNLKLPFTSWRIPPRLGSPYLTPFIPLSRGFRIRIS